jgi:hypothetical protein
MLPACPVPFPLGEAVCPLSFSPLPAALPFFRLRPLGRRQDADTFTMLIYHEYQVNCAPSIVSATTGKVFADKSSVQGKAA